MGIAGEKFIKLSNLAVAAAMKPHLWQSFLDEISKVLGTHVCTQLMGYDEVTNAAPLAYTSGWDPEILRLYEKHYANRNPYAENFDKIAVGSTMSTHQLVDTPALKKTAFYSDLLLPLEDVYCGGGSNLAFDSNRMFVVGGNIRAKDREKYEHDWLQLCEMLTPVLRQSVEISRIISGLSFEKWAAEQHKFGTGTAVFVVDDAMMIHFACEQAQKLLSKGTPVGTDLNRRLHFCSDEAQSKINALLRQRSQSRSNAFGNWYVKDEFGQRWMCRVAELRLGDLDQSPFGAFLTKSNSAVLFAIKREESASSFSEVLQDVIGLSRAEADSSIMLTNGKTTAEIAVFRNVSVHTVRNQIKSAMAKSGCRRQSDLVRKIEQQRQSRI